MIGKPGDRLVVASAHVGEAPREGVILETTEMPAGVKYRVRWSDGHESTFMPAVGSATILRKERRSG